MKEQEMNDISYDEAFDEATSEGEHKLEDSYDDAPQEELITEPEETVSQEEADANDDANDVEETEEAGSTADDYHAEEEIVQTDDSIDPNLAQLKALYELERERREKAEQRYRTSEGRFRAFREAQQEPTTAKPKKEPAVESRALKEFTEEFPEFVDPINELINSRVNAALDEVNSLVDKRVTPLAQQVESTGTSSHFDAIAAAHPDWETIVNGADFALWQASLSPYARSAVEHTIASGTATEIIAMFDEFKQGQGKTKTPTTPKAKPVTHASTPATQSNIDDIVAKAVKAALAVPASRNSTPKSPRVIDKDDFDAAFDEATRD